jgi:hypothetical protein
MCSPNRNHHTPAQPHHNTHHPQAQCGFQHVTLWASRVEADKWSGPRPSAMGQTNKVLLGTGLSCRAAHGPGLRSPSGEGPALLCHSVRVGAGVPNQEFVGASGMSTPLLPWGFGERAPSHTHMYTLCMTRMSCPPRRAPLGQGMPHKAAHIDYLPAR